MKVNVGWAWVYAVYDLVVLADSGAVFCGVSWVFLGVSDVHWGCLLAWVWRGSCFVFRVDGLGVGMVCRFVWVAAFGQSPEIDWRVAVLVPELRR